MKLSNLANVLRAAGLTVVETPGWATRGYAGQDLTEIRGVLWHHTATGRGAYATSNAPTLQMTINGRSDLAGPLCNITFGRDGTVYLVAAGVANHAGRGSAPGFPKDTGNHYLIGIEMESSGVAPWDWTADQIRIAPYLGAALEKAYLQGIPADLRLQLGHKEYSSEGKIDPSGWPGDMNGLRASINAVLNGSAAVAPQSSTITPQEDTLSAADVKEIKDYISAILIYGYQSGGKQNPGLADTINKIEGRTTPYLNAPTGDIPAKVLNQKFTLPDGTVANLSGILTAIHATPAAGPGTVADPTAVIHALRDQLNK